MYLAPYVRNACWMIIKASSGVIAVGCTRVVCVLWLVQTRHGFWGRVLFFYCSYVMPTPTNFGSTRRTAPHGGRNNAAKRAAAAANKKRVNNAFNETVKNIKSKMKHNNIMNGQYRNERLARLGLTQQQWYALAGILSTIQRYRKVQVIPVLQPISNRVRKTGLYTNANRNALIKWARSY